MNHRVQILDNDGNFIHKFGELGQNIGNFGSPRGIALDSYNNIYVSDVMFNNIQIFNKNGELLMVLGSYGEGFGEFALPEDISITKDNTIYVSDTNNKRLQVFKLLEIDKKGSSQ
jgi:DNA-binding beta-propeller fold protein YncE